MLKRLIAAAISCAALIAPAAAKADPSLHGFGDISIKNDYITPRGLRVTSDGMTAQALGGLVLVVPQAPDAAISELSFVAGAWMDLNPGYSSANSRSFNEKDFFAGANAKLGKNWKAGVQYVAFISPQDAFKTEKNLEFSLSFDDSAYMKPISIQPYVKLFYAMSGDSTVVVGKRGDTYDVEIGASPTLNLADKDVPLILTMPTWITVGPESYWGGGGNAGVFSTGLKVIHPLKSTSGAVSVYVGYQYYHLINDRLILAQSIINRGKSSRNLHLLQTGVSLGF